MLTDLCNCDCRYCYQKVSSKPKMGNLNLNYIELLDNLLIEFNTIQFFGGEPLVAENFIFELDSHIDNLINTHYLSSKPEYIFSSNLVELSTKFKLFLKKLSEEGTIFHFIITIDGNKHIHDKNRIFHNGNGTYQKILNNYHFLINHNMPCVDNIYVVYNSAHYQNNVSLQDCIEDIHKNFPTVPYITFNREGCFDETKISESFFFNQKYTLMDKIFNDILNEKKEYKNCIPFFKKELLYMASSLSDEDSNRKKCIFEGKKLSIIPNGDIYMCVDYYYAGELPIAKLDQTASLTKTLDNYTLSNNIKFDQCQNCSVRTLCRYCPRLIDTTNICNQNKKYYTMILSYLKQIYSNSHLLRYFFNYSELSNGILFLFYKYLRDFK